MSATGGLSEVGFAADLANKTQRLIQESAVQEGLGRLTKTVTFDVKTLESLRSEKGSDEGKVFNLVLGLNTEMDENPDAAVLQPLKDRAERILKDLEDPKTTGLAAMDDLAALAAEKEAAMKSARESGLSARAFGVYWSLREDPAVKAASIDPMVLAREANKLLGPFANAAVNPAERRRLRAALYQPLLKLVPDQEVASRGRGDGLPRPIGAGMKSSLYPAEELRCRTLAWTVKLRVNLKVVRLQEMKRKWGSCSSPGTVTLAVDLVDEAERFQDFVIVHDLLHLRVPRHGRLFTALLSAYMPGWHDFEPPGKSKTSALTVERNTPCAANGLSCRAWRSTR